VQVVKSAVVDPNGYNKVVIAGSAPDVYLATQMIQEVLYTPHDSNLYHGRADRASINLSVIHPFCVGNCSNLCTS
jgi:hypothetical protein